MFFFDTEHLDTKKFEAIMKVIEKLETYAQLMNYGIATVEERVVVGSSTSVIHVTNNSSNAMYLDGKVIHAITKEKEEKELVRQYTSIIDSLPALEKEVIIKKYLKEYTFKQLKEGTRSEIGISHPDIYLERAYINIALLDDYIDYTVQDHTDLKRMQIERENKKNKNKQLALLYLQQIKNKEHSNKKNVEMIEKCLDSIPNEERELLRKFVLKKHEDTFTRAQHFKIRRALLSFMYLYPEFDYTEKEYLMDIKKTTGGWKKCYEHVVLEKNVQLVFEPF